MSTFYGTCHNCGRTGHSKKNCYRQRKPAQAKQFASTVRCYDCNEQVADLKQHRLVCAKSRRAKSELPSEAAETASAAPQGKLVTGTTDWYALIDVSASMMGSRLEAAKTTLLKEIEPEMNEDDRLAIITFDTKAFFKLKPRAVGQVRKQQELAPLMDRIFARGATAIWDAIWLAVSQIRDKDRRTLLTVLTDGADNSSQHTYQEVLDLVATHENVFLSIVHVGDESDAQYEEICAKANGVYKLIVEAKISVEFKAAFVASYTRTN